MQVLAMRPGVIILFEHLWIKIGERYVQPNWHSVDAGAVRGNAPDLPVGLAADGVPVLVLDVDGRRYRAGRLPRRRAKRVKVFNDIADLERAVGSHFGYSDWHVITQHQIDMFAENTGDQQWIHVDPKKAADGPFGSTIAHGFLTLSLVPILAGQVYRVDGIRMAINYGADMLRFPSAVPAGSRIRAGVELVSVSAGGGGSRVVVRVTVEREGSDKPACVVDIVHVLLL